jgi:NADH-quinone oxidoreductase subunit F
LAGKIARGGLIEVPMGITIQEIVHDIGGGIENGKPFKAVQIGGPSGGCIPAELARTRVDYEDLTEVGAMMGSGGLLVMDDSDCMVDIARYFLSFTQNQSCGKCTFCRIGTRHMLRILEKICAGEGKKEDLDKLEEIAQKTKQGSLCGLGKTAPNPVLTTLTYFKDEYEAHLKGICPAKRCKELITYTIDDTCIGCTVCAQKCPSGAIAIAPYQRHVIDQNKCVKCGTCYQVCPTKSVNV